MSKTIRCDRCNRRRRNVASPDGQRWNDVWKDGYVVGHLCPDCQTPDENSEAIDNMGRFDYSTMTKTPDGRSRLKYRSSN